MDRGRGDCRLRLLRQTPTSEPARQAQGSYSHFTDDESVLNVTVFEVRPRPASPKGSGHNTPGSDRSRPEEPLTPVRGKSVTLTKHSEQPHARRAQTLSARNRFFRKTHACRPSTQATRANAVGGTAVGPRDFLKTRTNHLRKGDPGPRKAGP